MASSTRDLAGREMFSDAINLEKTFLRLTVHWIPKIRSNERTLTALREEYESIDGYIRDVLNKLPSDARVIKEPELLERLKNVKTDVKQIHARDLVTKYAQSYWIFKNDAVLRFIDDLLKSVKSLLRFEGHASIPVRKEITALKQKMTQLRDVTNYTSMRSNNSEEVKDLMCHIRWVTVNALMIFYSCLVDEMDEGVALEIKGKVSHLLQKSKPVNPEVREKYIRAFKSFNPSDTPWNDQLLLLRLVDYFLLDLMEQKEYLREDMIFLKTILVDEPEIRFERTQFKHLMRSTDEVICKAGAVIYAQETEDETARERNLSFSDLLKSIKFIRPYVLSLKSHEDTCRKLDLEKIFVHIICKWFPKINTSSWVDTYISIDAHIGDVYNHMSKDSQVVEAPKILERLMNIKGDVKQYLVLQSETIYDPSSWIFKGDNVIRFIDDFLICLYRLRSFEGHASTPIRKQIEEIEQIMRFSRDVTEYTTKRSNNMDELGSLMYYIRSIASSALIISYGFMVEELDDLALEIKETTSTLLQMMKPISPEIRLIYLRAFKSLDPSVSDSPWDDKHLLVCLVDFFLLDQTELMETLRQDMIFLKDILVDQAQLRLDWKQHTHLLRSIDEVICKAGTVIYAEENTDTARERDVALVDLLKSIKITRTHFMKIFVGNFPSTDEFWWFDFFLKNLEVVLQRTTDMRNDFETMWIDLLYLRSFLDKIKDQCDDEDLKDVWGHIIFVAHMAEYYVDSNVIEPCEHLRSQLLGVAEEIKLIKTQVIEIYEKKAANISNMSAISRVASQERSRPNIEELVVGFEEEAQHLMNCLTVFSKDRDISCIIGMPGLGKTTLARKVYNHSSVQRHFDVQAWVCVSQTYRLKDLLLEVLDDLIELDEGMKEKSEHELTVLLYKNLKGQRYLVVLDDVWDTRAWDALRKSFPDDKNQSRILITSRMHDVAQKINPALDKIHSLRQFRDDESWMLLKAKLFQGKDCPKHLLEVGKQIAVNCKGLPLSVSLAAGILSGMEEQESQWKLFADSLSSQIVRHEGNGCMAIIELSYRHLPGHLKSCFLYLGAFPEDQEIQVRKLTWLWISEGFVQNTESERVEDVAAGYLTDLIGRNLVMRSKYTSRTAAASVKTCRLHDLMRDFCLEKASEENFMHRVSSLSQLFPHTETSNSASSSLITYSRYRLSISSKRNHFIMAKPFSPNARSLLFFAEGDNHPNHPYDASFIPRNFKIIRVLDLGHINIKDPFNGIELLLHLRYLSLVGDMESIPSSIANLWRLEVFVFKGVGVELVSVPDTIWSMVNLRHLHINDGASFDLNNQNSSMLDNLESFSTPSLAHGDELHEMLNRTPNLRKLKCLVLCNRDGDGFPMLNFLSQLESLKASGDYNSFRSELKSHFEFQFPSNLKKLTLSGFCIPWSEMSSIGSLPNLEVLKLIRGAFRGKNWIMKVGEFLKLKYLKLEALDIEYWDATDDHLPCLEKLVLRKCRKLVEIPTCFADIITLQLIEVQWCRHSAVLSALYILQEQREYGNENFKLLLHNKDKDKQKGSASSS